MRISVLVAGLLAPLALISNGGTNQALAAPACGAIWSASTVYHGGDQISEYGVNYTANYYTQGDDPVTNNGNGLPWSETSICHACEIGPTVPTGLVAVATNDTQTDLIWTPSAVPANCSVSGYKVFQNSVQIVTTTGNNAAINGLTPSKNYSLKVSAFDSFGASGQSAPLTVRTKGLGQGRGAPPVFAPYIDMSQTVSETLPTIATRSGIMHFTLAFVLSPGDCSAAWGGVGSIDNEAAM
jgi:chitodextrinase